MNKKLAGILGNVCSVADWMSGERKSSKENYAAGYRMGENGG